MRRLSLPRMLVVLCAGAALAAAAAPLGAVDIFKAQMLTGKAPVEPPLIKIQIEIKQWTTPEEVRAFQQTLNDAGTDAFLNAYSKTDIGLLRRLSGGIDHPPVDDRPLPPSRALVFGAVALSFIVTFMPVPLRINVGGIAKQATVTATSPSP